MIINIYLSNLARYTEGKENGRWLQLPMESTRLEKVFAEIVGKDQEHIILDYKAPFEISEYENIFALNEFMGTLEDCGLDEDGLKAIFAVADTKEEKGSKGGAPLPIKVTVPKKRLADYLEQSCCCC